MSTPAPDDRPGTAAKPAADERWGAVVVGGGVAGLVAARELARAGVRTLVVEGRDAVGGAVRGHVVGGLRLDAGAESYATRGGTVAAYLEDLGLADAIVAPGPLGSWVQLPGGAGPLPRTGLLGIPSSPWSADTRRTLGWTGAARACLDLVLPRRVGARAGSLGALVRARMGERVLARLVRPVVGGVHAADPDDLAVDAVSPGLPAALREHRSLARAVRQLRAAAPAGAAVQGLAGGMHVMVDALADDVLAHGGALRVRTRAVATRPGRLVAVELSDGTVVHAERLVVAAPASAELLRPLLSADGGAQDEVLGFDDGADVRLVTLVLDAPELDAAPRGTGVLVAREVEQVAAKALTHGTAKWPWLAAATPPGTHVVRLSYGRSDDEPADDSPAGPDARPELVARALADARVLLGVPLRDEQVLASAVVRWTQSLPRPSARHRDATAALRAAVAARPAGTRVAVCGAWVAGNGLASVIPDAVAAARSVLD
ncbi:protoporphyrinogen oxidase [Cellulomonas sp.]|uniref:protoporphyrinogen oxidase n=1 Tax=Cellulomonas sp. TaxID=40001 RepID=UPI002588F761|nr:protoporphyrinogen oxidase [Cellulomonas sp.]MCR6688659.1 protoporphyrinogen oxidase [Cellulomonas sp.]